MFLTNLFNLKEKCIHSSISPNLDFSYCPDCGKLIKNEWFITRCACCGVKLHTISKNGEIIPQKNFCTNCGASSFIVEKLDKIDFVNIHYAVLQKIEVEESCSKISTTQCWQEKSDEKPKLLVQYL